MTTTVDRDDKGYWLLARDGKRVEKHGPFPTPGAMRAWEELNITTGVEDAVDEDTSDTHEDSADSGKRRNVRRDDSMV